MKILFIVLLMLFNTGIVQATPSQDYLNRFMTFQQWSQGLPKKPDDAFLEFIKDERPLSTKLRSRYLYYLAKHEDWTTYLQYYNSSSKDINLQCYGQLAKYKLGQTKEALQSARLLWLSGDSLPESCNMLFNLLVKSELFDDKLIKQRIILALDKRNLSLARFLLKKFKEPRLQDEALLTTIAQNPTKVSIIGPGDLHDYFYLFGLKRLVATNIDKAVKQWNNPKTNLLLNEAQKQAFLTHLTIYKSMKNHPDAPDWFAKIKSVFYSEALLDWQIRFALKNKDWKNVEKLINESPEKSTPCWQYWLARSLEAQGKKDEAHSIYQKIAPTRHYYGFLASTRLHQKPSFENEVPVASAWRLQPYQPITTAIKNLYLNNQKVEASRLINDFISELPKDEKSALIYWLANDLNWYEKSLYLANTEELSNQLLLRFPLIYQNEIRSHARNYHIPAEFIYAIIRQESGFRDHVVSPVGARGLMQVMPKTASAVAKTEKIPYVDQEQLFTYQKNIHIGVAYLKQLTARFNHHPVLVAAAYNAGPHQVRYWLKNHPPKDIDIWIDTLPWHETRNYLKNIMAFYMVYQYRMNQKPDLSDFMRPLQEG